MSKENLFWLALIAGFWYLYSQNQSQQIMGPTVAQGGSPNCGPGTYQYGTQDGQPICLPTP